MREIKFRAWDGNSMIMNPLGFPELFPLNSLMQFTGLYDKDGNEIYEGDIISVRDPYYDDWSKGGSEVVFSLEYVGGWVISSGGINLNLGTRQNHIKIIGNIHENPELLEGKN